MGKYANLKFFDNNSDELNLVYDEVNEVWEGMVYLPEVSVGLYETLTIYMFEEAVGILGETKYIKPISQNSSDGLALKLHFEDGYDTSSDIFMYTTSIESDELYVKHEKTQYTKFSPKSNIVSTSNITNTVDSSVQNTPIQINVAIKSDSENYHNNTLSIFEMTDGIISHEIANIRIYGETIGEDERLQDLLSNMGMSIKPTDYIIFEDSDVKEGGIDWKLINRKRKELLLQASEIKPFIGTYKAILNAIKYFGYENLTLKEYWLNVNEQAENFGKLKAVAVANQDVKGFLSGKRDSELPSSNLKKTSKFSLVYRLNNFTGEFDKWDIPKVEEVTDFTPDEVLIKLYGLKKKLQKEYLPLQSKIVDIVGEGDYFSQFNINTWNNQQNIQTQNAGIDLVYDIFPKDRDIYIEDLRKVDSKFTGKGQDFEVLANDLGIDASIVEFYDNYDSIDMSTFNDMDGGPIGAPLILKATDSLPQSWDSAEFSFDDIDYSYSMVDNVTGNLMTWDNWWTRNIYEIEWRLVGPQGYDRTFRGPTVRFIELSIVLPHSGKYSVEMSLYDLYNVRSVMFKKDAIEVFQKNVEIYGMYQALNEEPKWNIANYKWNTAGAIWDLAGENTNTVDDFLASYYLTLDRANYINSDSDGWEFSTVERYRNNLHEIEHTSGPYSWLNLTDLNWNDGATSSWEMTNIDYDESASFDISFYSDIDGISDPGLIYITKVNERGQIDSMDAYYLTSPMPTDVTDIDAITEIASELNGLDRILYPILSNFIYNPIQTDFDLNGIVDMIPKINAVAKRNLSSYDYGLARDIGGSTMQLHMSDNHHFKSNNPKYNTTKIIESHDTVNKFNHMTFSFDNTKAPGIIEHEWTIKNNSENVDDIYYSNKWLTYVFTKKGNYTLSLKTKDVNGNINNTTKNILTII